MSGFHVEKSYVVTGVSTTPILVSIDLSTIKNKFNGFCTAEVSAGGEDIVVKFGGSDVVASATATGYELPDGNYYVRKGAVLNRDISSQITHVSVVAAGMSTGNVVINFGIEK